jgi:hypothetical protein
MRSDIAHGGTLPDYELLDHTSVPRRPSEPQGDDALILTRAQPLPPQGAPGAPRARRVLSEDRRCLHPDGGNRRAAASSSAACCHGPLSCSPPRYWHASKSAGASNRDQCGDQVRCFDGLLTGKIDALIGSFAVSPRCVTRYASVPKAPRRSRNSSPTPPPGWPEQRPCRARQRHYHASARGR